MNIQRLNVRIDQVTNQSATKRSRSQSELREENATMNIQRLNVRIDKVANQSTTKRSGSHGRTVGRSGRQQQKPDTEVRHPMREIQRSLVAQLKHYGEVR
jgi:hypothetical protein